MKVAWEGEPFQNQQMIAHGLNPFVLPSYPKNATVDGIRYREQGYWQVNIWEVQMVKVLVIKNMLHNN